MSKRHSIKVFIALLLIPSFLLTSIPTTPFGGAPHALRAGSADAFALAPGSNFTTTNTDKPSDLQGMLSAYSHFEAKHLAMIRLLFEIGQQHLFAKWDLPGVKDELKKGFLNQLIEMNEAYQGGLKAYWENAVRLIKVAQKSAQKVKTAQEGENPFPGYTPEVPQGINIDQTDERFHALQEKGLQHVSKLAIVMVAGGLGERLQCPELNNGEIKIGLHSDLVTDKTYLQHYIENISALQERAKEITGKDCRIPFAIMTSDETHEKTKELLKELGYSVISSEEGEKTVAQKGEDKIVLLKQGLVPAVASDKGEFVLDAEDLYRLQAKPHGHGDVHMLLFKHGLVDQWVAEGRTHTVFMQDTNGQAVNGFLAGLAVSIEQGLDFNSITVPRTAKENAGAITKLVHEDGRVLVCNVEYNQLGPFLKATVNKEGDVPDPETGKSPYPGNLNVFVVENKAYSETLRATHGIVAEFVNPKFKPDGTFPPTRLEVMMQDLAKVMPQGSNISFTNFKSKRDVFSPVKNSISYVLTKKLEDPDSMATGEADYYKYFRKLLALAGVIVDVEGKERRTRGIPYQEGAKVVLASQFAVTAKDVTSKIKGGSITDRSVLEIDGRDVALEDVSIDGTLIIRTARGVKLKIKGLQIKNEGWEFVDLTDEEMRPDNSSIRGDLKIRGYKVLKHGQRLIEITEPGEYEIQSDGIVRKVLLQDIFRCDVRAILDHLIADDDEKARAISSHRTTPTTIIVDTLREMLSGELAAQDRVVLEKALKQAVMGNWDRWAAAPVAMGDLNVDMFRDYDYRYVKEGVDLKPEMVFRFGLAWAKMALEKVERLGIKNRKVLLARDARKIKSEQTEALSAALRYAGLDVVYVADDGPNAVTSYSWAAQEHKPLMSIFMTASHVSQPENVFVRGFKVAILDESGTLQSLTTDEIKTTSYDIITDLINYPHKVISMEALSKGRFFPCNIDANCVRMCALVGKVAASGGSLYELATRMRAPGSSVAVLNEWEGRLVGVKPLTGMKAVVEGANTPSGKLAADTFTELGAQVVLINGDIKEVEGPHKADPSKDENLKQLRETIQKEGADFGIAFDLDGDRGAIVVPIRGEGGQIRFETLAPDNLMVAMLRSMNEEWGYNPKTIGKNGGVIRDVLGTFGVNDRAKGLGIDPFQTDAGYVFLKALRRDLLSGRAETVAYAIPIYGERSGHCWLDVTGEFENPIAVTALFAVMVNKAKYKDGQTSSKNPFFETYVENTVPYRQSTRFQPLFHPEFLKELSPYPKEGKPEWVYDPADTKNPPQAVIGAGRTLGIEKIKAEFVVGKTYDTPAGKLTVTEIKTRQDLAGKGEPERFADVFFEQNGKFAGRFVFRASSNDPTFVCSFETPVWESETINSQTVHDRYISIGGLVLDWLERNNIAIVTGGGKYPNKEATEPVVFEYRRKMKIAVGAESILSLLGLQSINRQMDVLYGRARDEVKGLSPKAEHMAEIGFETKDGKKINRLGWTPANLRHMLGSEDMQRQIAGVIKDAEAIRGRYKYVIFCGMGGSGLSVQTVKTTFGEPEGLKIFSLRTTDPAVIKDILDEITKDAGSLEEALKNTLWIPISKSGTTEETVSHKKYAEDLYKKIFGDDGINIKNHMWVMTDKGSKMDTLDYEQRFIQLNDGVDIGGRFTSPTTRVFLLPLALIAPDRVMAILEAAGRMNEAEDKDIDKDPFVVLGAYLYDMAANMGKDKVTFIVPEELRDLPLWSEELFEESLGKGGKGVTIFYGEELSEASLKGVEENDRVFLRINMAGRKTNEQLWSRLKEKGYPVFEIDMDDINSIGGVMLGLQRTIAAIGYLWDICFVDQPAVEGYKNATREVMRALKPGEKVEVPTQWKSVAFGKLKLYYDRLIEVGAFNLEELEAAVKGLGADMGNAPAVYAAIINILKSKPRFEAKEFASYGRMTQRMQAVLQQARTAIFTNALRMPSKLGEGPDKNHSYQENIEGGKDMWFSTYFMPLRLEQPAALEYDENRIKAQTIGTVNSIVKNRRKVALITFDSTTKEAEEDLRLFFAEVERYLTPATKQGPATAGTHSEATDADPLLVGRIINEVVSGRLVAEEMASLFNLLNQAERSKRDALIDMIKNRLDHIVGDFSEADRAVAKERADAFKVEWFKLVVYLEMMEEDDPDYTTQLFKDRLRVVFGIEIGDEAARKALDELSARPGVHKIALPDGNAVYRKIQPGDTVSVQLPQGEVVLQAVAASPAKKRILRVDDDEAVCEGDKDILEFKGYEVVTCLNGQAALDRFIQDRGRFDLIIADGRMPVMGGIELVKAIRALEFGKKVPVIIITGGLGESEQAEAQSLRSKGDIFDMLTKPVSYQWFLNRVSEALESGAAAPAKKKVLVVDDDDSLQHLYRRGLSGEGHEVVVCSNIEEALVELKKGGIGLVITDVMMAGGDGFELLHRMEAAGIKVPTIVMTGKVGDRTEFDLQQGVDATIDEMVRELGKPYAIAQGTVKAVLMKPFEMSELVSAANSLLKPAAVAPAGREGQPVAAGAVPVAPSQPPTTVQAKKRMLVVESDEGIRGFIEKLFKRKYGGIIEIVVCSDGWAALGALARGKFDLAIIQAERANKMSGHDLLNKIRKELGIGKEALPIIMTTMDIEGEAPILKNEIVTLLQKPFGAEDITSAVNQIIPIPKSPAELSSSLTARAGADNP